MNGRFDEMKNIFFNLALTAGASGINMGFTALKSFAIKKGCSEALESLSNFSNQTEIIRMITIGDITVPARIPLSDKFRETVKEIPEALGDLLSDYVIHTGLQYTILIAGLGLSFTTIYQIAHYIKNLNAQFNQLERQVQSLTLQNQDQEQRIFDLEQITQKQEEKINTLETLREEQAKVLIDIQNTVHELKKALNVEKNQVESSHLAKVGQH